MPPKPIAIIALTLAILCALAGCARAPKAADPAAQEQAEALTQQVWSLRDEGKYAEAIALLKENEAVFRRAGQLADMYGNISWYALFAGDFKSTEQAARKGLAVDKTLGWLKTNLAHALFLQNKRPQAVKLYRELSQNLYADYNKWTYTQAILTNWDTLEQAGIFPPEQGEINMLREEFAPVVALEQEIGAAIDLYNEGKYQDSIALLLPLKETADRKHALYIYVLSQLAHAYDELSNYSEALVYYTEVRDIQARTIGKKHPDYTASLNTLGNLYQAMGNYAKAEPYYLEAMAIREKALGKQHPDYAQALNNLGSLYQAMGNYAKAEPYFLEALAINEKALGKEHPDYATVLAWVGILHLAMGDYAKAEPYFLEALAIREKALGKEHPNYAKALNNLGNLYHTMRNYTKAEPYLLEALAIWDKALGKEHPDYAASLNNLGSLYQDMGDYAKAEPYFLEALAIREKALGKEHPDYAESLHNLGTLYYYMWNYTKVEPYFLEALAIREKALGKQHPDYAASLNNLGNLYQDMGDYGKAEPYLLESLAIWEKTLGKHTYYALSLNNLGNLYQDMGDYGKAEPYLLESLAIWEKALGKEHFHYAITLNNLGSLYQAMGNYAKAEPYFLEALAIREKALGKEHPDYSSSLSNLSFLYLDKGDYTKSETFTKESVALRVNLINHYFSFMSEQQRSTYWDIAKGEFEGSYSLSAVHPAASVNALNYNNTLFTKGLLLRTTNAVRDAIYSSGDARLIEQFETLGSIRQQLSALQQKEDVNEAYRKSLEKQAEDLDKALTRSSAAFRDVKADMSLEWQDVRKSLKADEAAVEFVSFKLYDKKWTGKTLYAALVLRQGMAAPAWIPLCEEQQIQEILSRANGKSSSEQARILYDVFGSQLYSTVWEPLEKELAGVKTIFYSPAGLLHKISFNALPAQGAQRLADKYDLNLVSSTREVVHADKNNTASMFPDSSVIYGGLQYDEDVALMQSTARSYGAAGEPGPKQPVSVVSALPPGSTRGGGSWGPLPASRTESLRIHGYLNDKNIPAALYTDNLGNEESFKHLDGSKTNLIHLATHGFFLEDIEQNHDNRDLVERLGGGSKAFENPLLRSGLILAGGNHAWREEAIEGVEDGILTADEISRLNLTGTKLVVLSACQTGLGEVNNGEGVFGLQRAFKLAGVETLIMSLWEVDDDATSQLMAAFYQQWLSGKTKQDSFKEAQRQVRVKYPSPYYWAAFVLMD
ncbi:hypothetical protein FACS189485_05450 [Spirochaetia bacterium]|nr:hypothetical protein FACS189485_05450 [Spirochaetia bacterium]